MTSVTAVCFAALLVAFGGSLDPTTVPGGAWLPLVAFGTFSALAVQAFYGGVGRIGGARAALLSTIEPVYTISLATLLLGETLTPVQLVGGALVIGGVLLAETGGRRDPRVAGGSTRKADPTEPTTGAGVREAVPGG
jgi:drug/metabolite transporter (DMT)-like permease